MSNDRPLFQALPSLLRHFLFAVRMYTHTACLQGVRSCSTITCYTLTHCEVYSNELHLSPSMCAAHVHNSVYATCLVTSTLCYNYTSCKLDLLPDSPCFSSSVHKFTCYRWCFIKCSFCVVQVHLPSMTVFPNWPTTRSPLSFPKVIDFSVDSRYLGIGNDKGRALLYRLKHYKTT